MIYRNLFLHPLETHPVASLLAPYSWPCALLCAAPPTFLPPHGCSQKPPPAGRPPPPAPVGAALEGKSPQALRKRRATCDVAHKQEGGGTWHESHMRHSSDGTGKSLSGIDIEPTKRFTRTCLTDYKVHRSLLVYPNLNLQACDGRNRPPLSCPTSVSARPVPSP